MITSDSPHLRLAQGERVHSSQPHIETHSRTSRMARLHAAGGVVLIPAMVAVGFLAHPALRHWLVSAVTNIAVLGGIVAAPLLSLVAWIGMVLPARAPLHEAAPALFIGAMIWLASAFVFAHATNQYDAHDDSHRA